MNPALLFTALLLATATVSAAQPAQSVRPAPTRGGHRFLILIEASKDMNRLADGVIETSLHLVGSGFKGQARDGDAFAIWPYRDRVAGHLFEPVTWSVARLKEQEKVAEVFVAPLKYEGLADLGLAVKELLAVGAASESATLILISPGEKPVSGTPFDTYIRNAYEREGRASRREKLPVVTAFLASGGLIVDCIVSRGGTNAALPTLPDDLRSRVRAVAPPVVATNAPVPRKSPAPVPAPVSAPKKQAATEPTPSAPLSAPPPPPPAVRMSIAPPPPRTLPVTSDEPAPASSNAPVAAVQPPAIPPPAAPATPVSVSPAPAAVEAPPSPVAAVEGGIVPVASVAESSRRPTFVVAGALIGAAVMLLVVMIALLLRPARGSSISAAMESGKTRRDPPGGKQ